MSDNTAPAAPALDDDVRVLREAMAAGPTPGPWSTISRGAYWGEEEADVRDADEQDVAGAEFVQPIGDNDTTRGQLWAKDARYIAAAGPDRIARVLDAMDALQRERDEALAALAAAQEHGGACQCGADEVCALRRERDAAIRARGAARPQAQSGAPQPPDPDAQNRA